jgi:hypothetical protein
VWRKVEEIYSIVTQGRLSFLFASYFAELFTFRWALNLDPILLEKNEKFLASSFLGF